MIFRNRKGLKGTGIVITEFLTPTRSALLKKCLEKIPGDKSIWTDNGRVLVKLHGQEGISHIANELELENFLEKKYPNMPTRI